MESEDLEMPSGNIDLAQLRERIHQDPNYLQQILQELQTTNPQMYQGIQEDTEGALQALLGGDEVEGENEEQDMPEIPVTEEEKGAIDRVRSIHDFVVKGHGILRNASSTSILRMRKE